MPCDEWSWILYQYRSAVKIYSDESGQPGRWREYRVLQNLGAVGGGTEGVRETPSRLIGA